MPFPPALTATQLDVQRTGRFSYKQYLLTWRQDVIFQAQINQATFADSFATLTYDNVTVGAYTDIKSDFICYVSATAGKIIGAEHTFRVRADGSYAVATSSVININETSAALSDNWYIMVVKEVRIEAKVPRTITGATPAANSYPRDYAITFRRLIPIVYGLPSAAVLTLNSDGVADFDWTALVLITDKDAGTATWLWELDGMAFQSGSSSTATITARASAAGQYLVRVYHTDTLGQKGYFTIHVWVVPADKSSVVNLAFAGAPINADTYNGLSMTINADATSNKSLVTRIDTMPDLTFCAVWYDTKQPIVTSNIAFVGWFLAETVINNFTPDNNTLLNTQFQVDGVAGRIGDTVSRRIPMVEDSTPTKFREIENLTPWRAVAYFLTEHSTLPNVCSVQFGDTSEDFRYPRFGSSDSSILESLVSLLFTIKGAINYARSGELYLDRIAWYLSTSDRNALTTVANCTTTDMAVRDGGLLFNVSRRYVPQIGREVGGGAYYDTTSLDIQLLKATTPAVAQSQGNELVTLNRQILLANSSINTAAAELGQRTADDTEARNPQEILYVTLPPAFWWLSPHQSLWYTWTINKTDNNAGIEYTTATRWTLRSLTLTYDVQAGIPIPVAQFQKETQGTSYQTLVTTPIDGEVQFFDPVMPVVPVYAAFPAETNAMQPDPANPTAEDEPPFSADDVGIVKNPQDPSVTVANNYADGTQGMVWDDSSLWRVSNIPGAPTYTDFTPTNANTITNGKFDPFSARAWCVSNDGATSQVHRTKAFGDLQWEETEVNGIYTRLAITSTAGRLYVYAPAWKWSHTFDFTVDEQGWSVAPVDNERGVYTPATGWEFTQGDYPGIRILIDFATTYITYFKGTYDAAGGTSRSIGRGWGQQPNPDDGTLAEPYSYPQKTPYDLGAGVELINVLLPLNANRLYWYASANGATMTLTEILIQGLAADPFNGGGGGGDAATVYSTDHGETFASAVTAGQITADDAGFDPLRVGTEVFVAIDAEIVDATSGGAYSSTGGGGTVGTYALCIWGYGTDAEKFLFGTKAAIGGETLWYVEGASQTAITPNDGANDGLVVTPDALCTDPASDDHIFGLLDFSGTVKFCYTADKGTTWQFNTQVSASASYIRVKRINGLYNVYIADGSSLWWGMWDGTGAITLQEKGTPSAALKGVEIR